jgi:predicted transcriptional regulator
LQVNRPIASVSRDIKILSNYGFLDIEKKGVVKTPKLIKDPILISID